MIKAQKIDRTYKDLKEIRRLYGSSFSDDERVPFDILLERISEEAPLYVYHEDDKLLGLSFLNLLDKMAYLSYLTVEEDQRGRGYGTLILEKIKEDFREYRIVVDIEEVKDDQDGQKKRRKDFYLRNGFKETGIHYYIWYVDYELLSYNGLVSREEWHSIIRKHWGVFADQAIYK